VTYTADAAWRETVAAGWKREAMRAALVIDRGTLRGPLRQDVEVAAVAVDHARAQPRPGEPGADGVTYTADAAWRETVAAGWKREAMRAALDGLDGLAFEARSGRTSR
jgi:nuclear transport factor 2 (NTF2) superfamily protein